MSLRKKSSESFSKLLKEIVGGNIRKIRKSKKIKQYQLCEKINMTPQQISLYEVGENLPPLNVVISLAKAMDCSVTDIYTPEKLDSLKNVFDYDDLVPKRK